jgi:Spy/CpxP family protein refolding chaperone
VLAVTGVGCGPSGPDYSHLQPTDRAKVLEEIGRKERRDEYDQMILELGVDGRQLTMFLQRVEAFHAGRDRIDAGPIPRQREQVEAELRAARSRNDADEVRRLQARRKELGERYWQARGEYRAAVMEVLTLDQQRAWCSHRLYDRVSGRLRRAKMTDAQVARARAICDEEAAKLVQRGTIRSDPYLRVLRDAKVTDPVAERIIETVLSDEQREKLRR